jgi:S-adenosylmethionine-diacylgycerolhomoserine-N-methlytransferase
MSPSELAADARILWRMLRGQPRSGSHAECLEGFYAPQATRYDAFRARLLHGRADLIAALDLPAGARVVELGCGTGSNLVYLGNGRRKLADFASIQLVDLCPALLGQARQRVTGLTNVEVIEADATTWQPQQPVDCVYLSYALSMMPDWRGVLANAWSMLAPGGQLGIVDFHLPITGNRVGNRVGNQIGNLFWKTWFAHDGVHLSAEHLPALQTLGRQSMLQERRAAVPYLPLLQAPYYLSISHKPRPPCTPATTA